MYHAPGTTPNPLCVTARKSTPPSWIHKVVFVRKVRGEGAHSLCYSYGFGSCNVIQGVILIFQRGLVQSVIFSEPYLRSAFDQKGSKT
jgi:hypothetical protein